MADDHPVIRRLLVAQLSQAGYAVEEAADGLDVLRQLEAQAIDLLLVDCQMPEMDGFEAIARVRQSSPLHPVILAFSGRPEHAHRCLALGADEFLEKPVDRDYLLARVAFWRERCSPQSDLAAPQPGADGP